MAQEQESTKKLTSIYIDIDERYLEAQTQDGTVLRFSYSPEGIFLALLQSGTFQGGTLEGAARRLVMMADQPEGDVEAARSEAVDLVNEPAPARREKTPALVLPGRLKNAPTEGRPDGHGKPTAWAPFLTHLDGQEGALLVSASFHNHTRDIALRLSAGDAITAQGYLHPNRDPSRLASFSIFHLIAYPGKPPSTRS